MNEIPMLSDAPAAERAREGEDIPAGKAFGQAPGLEVSRGPSKRPIAAIIAIVCVVATSISSYIFTNPQMPRIDPIIEFPWFIPLGPYFTAIWLILTLTMIASFYLILRSAPDNKSRRKAIAAYVAQLALHTTWAWLLFADRAPRAGLYVACLLVVVLLAAVWLAARIDKRASALLAPHLAWAIFALISTLRIATAGGS
jgi:tryptophan-rich sensory protein